MTRVWLLIPLLLSTTAIGPCQSQPLGSLDAGPGCDYAGAHQAAGTTFPSTDGCNSCNCLADGRVACTLRGCLPDSGHAPDAPGPIDAPNADRAGPTAIALCGSGPAIEGAAGHVVFDSDRASFNRDIYMINTDGTGLTRLTTDSSMEKEPSVSADGRLMSFTSDRTGSLQIYVMDLASHAVTPLTNQPGGADQSSFSHDGTLIAFHSGPSVYVIHPDGTGLTKIATGLDAFNAYFWPHFTLDDGGLIFDRNNEIDTVALDGSGLRMVVQNTTTTIKSPSVSPTNGDVVYQAICQSSGGLSIWTTPFSVTTQVCAGRRVPPVGEPTSQRADWGPGDVFAYERVDTSNSVATIALISRAPGSAPCLLTPGTDDNRNPTWSR